jgi:hypothetical protein
MNNINPLANAQFPASSNTWDFMNEMIQMVAKLAGIGGANYILSGCVDQGVSVTDGYIVINGEILTFTGGPKSDYIIITEAITGVNSGGINYPNIYTTRSAQFGAGVGQIAWSSFLPLLRRKYVEFNNWNMTTTPAHAIDVPAGIDANRIKHLSAMIKVGVSAPSIQTYDLLEGGNVRLDNWNALPAPPSIVFRRNNGGLFVGVEFSAPLVTLIIDYTPNTISV